MQFDLFDSDPAQVQNIVLPDAEIQYDETFLAANVADKLLSYFQQQIPWRQDSIRLYGKSVNIPRLQCWFGDPGTAYTYSGLVMEPLPWPQVLQRLKAHIEMCSGCQFNACLANLYRDGLDSMGWHADDEPELGLNPVIASVTLGEARAFDLRHQVSGQKHRIHLKHGSLLIMSGATQHFWQHALPKTRSGQGPRLNFTFRWVYCGQ